TQSELQRNRVSLHVELANDLPLILGDRIALQQVMLNLLINAIEAMSGVGEGPCFNSRCRFALMAEVGSDRSVLKAKFSPKQKFFSLVDQHSEPHENETLGHSKLATIRQQKMAGDNGTQARAVGEAIVHEAFHNVSFFDGSITDLQELYE